MRTMKERRKGGRNKDEIACRFFLILPPEQRGEQNTCVHRSEKFAEVRIHCMRTCLLPGKPIHGKQQRERNWQKIEK
jgi:hypothetical protein